MPKSPAQVRRADRGEEVRRRLLGAAVELVPEVGWQAVSTRMLAEQAGVAPGLVHYHFRSVDDLLRQAAVREITEVLAAFRGSLTSELDLEAGLTAMVRFLDPYTGTDPASLLFVEAYLASTRDLELQRELAVLVAEFVEDLGSWLAGHGVPAPGATAAVLGAAVDGLMLHRPLEPGLGVTDVLPALRRLLGTGVPAGGRGQGAG